MLKKWLLWLLSCLTAASCLAGCAAPSKAEKLTVVTAIFPQYDWVRQIIGPDSEIDLQLLCDDGMDPHSFQPTVGDLVTVADCDLLIFGGGESDEWLEGILAENTRSDRIVLELMPLLGENIHTAENIEGMQLRETEEEADEHIWLSLRNAAQMCTAIADALCRLDPGQGDVYRRNLAEYLEKLDALDQRYRTAVEQGRVDTILVCDRFPLRYLVEDYGLNYYAAFPGCSSESGASFSTIVFLSDRVRALELDSVLILEGNDGKIAKTVADNSGNENISVLTFHSMQSISREEAAELDYLTIMEQNCHVLEKALQ